jgi:biopolymer transport protein TolR
MRPYRLRRHHKSKPRADGGGHMTLIPFIDVLTIMVVFLLLNTSDVEILPNTKAIQIPESISQLKPRATVVVMITKNSLLVDGRTVISVQDVINAPDAVIAPLKTALQDTSDKILANAAKEDIADREVTILGDRNTPYSVLRKVMATCTDAAYGKVSLAVVEREGAGAPRPVAAL